MNLSSNVSSTYIASVFQTYVFTTIATFGLVTNIINIIVFKRILNKDKMYIYLLLFSVNDFFYLLLWSFFPFGYCDSLCSDEIDKDYFSQFVLLYFDNYITSCLAISNILIELVVSMQRLSIITNSKILKILRKISPYKTTAITSLISFMLYLNEVCFFKIGKIENTQNYYYIMPTEFESEYQISYIFSIIVQSFRGPVCLTLVLLVNSLIWYHFRKQMKRKSVIKSKLSKFIRFHFDLRFKKSNNL
jgi:hypothetical protein